MQIETVYQLIATEREAVDAEISRQLHSGVVLVNQIGRYIINSGGKRLRPMLILLVAKAWDYQGSAHHRLGAVIEFIHTATLLHDDVVDGSDLRRGNDTANRVWGNEAAVLVGDFLYSRAFQMMVSLQNMRVMEVLADTTNTIAEGEVQQLLNIHNADIDEESYLRVIRSKTAQLFAASAQLGAIICNRSAAEEQAMARFGMHLGTAFQIVDDALDYRGNAEELGKNLGDDLAEGKPTLPLIHILRHGTQSEKRLVREVIEQGDRNRIDAILEAIEANRAIDYTLEAARNEAELALQQLTLLPDNDLKSALITLTRYAVDRTY
ncbi:octaprenyl diphosphate synthase [Ectothiorhodospiraceae bacterium BW-2]|nr:octaprenyl diphosphate synthase [Ectothiorhodospiraceae bacterium BW-2]